MVKEVGDKINGNRSSATKKPRPKSLPAQGIVTSQLDSRNLTTNSIP